MVTILVQTHWAIPKGYYTPPSEAVEEIQMIRGAASLQFGPQFGGLINYKLKKGVSTKKS